jgi:hypothetical protein
MRNTLRWALALLLAVVAIPTRANPVDVRAAREVAVKFVSANLDRRSTGEDDVRLVKTYFIPDGRAACYVFNLEPGFVIVAADDCAIPILGYSDEGRLRPDDIPVQMETYLKGFVKQLQYGIENQRMAELDVAAQWESIRQDGYLHGQKTNRSVGPLLSSRWDQSCYYNNLCPADSDGSCGHVAVGCVATAMAQVMRYWGYPTTGQGTHSYTPDGYATQYVNFGATTYNWSNMPDRLYAGSSSTQVNAVATLMWHCGVAANMQYGAQESGAYSVDALSGLKEYFRYPIAMYGDMKSDNASWLQMVKICLDHDCPLYYDAQDDNGRGGHAFVCDGYDSNDYLHFNWGWDGYGDGYFALDALDVAVFQFNTDHYAIFNFTPDPITFTQSVAASPSNGGTVSGAGTYNLGVGCTLRATPNTGYSFSRWLKNGSGVSTSATYSFRVLDAASYVAVFTPNNYTITASASPSEGGMVTGAGTYSYGSTCTLNATALPGYSFVRWTKNGSQVSTNASYQFTVTENASYVAEFAETGYTITATANPTEGGTVSGAGNYGYGSLCTLTATPNAGYTFDHWSRLGQSVSTDAEYSFYVYGSLNLVANFVSAPALPTVTVDAVDVTPYEAYIHVLATDDGGYPITEMCLNMGEYTYCNNYIVDNGSWINLNNLTPSTTYSAIPLATNSQGTAYGEVTYFTTLPAETSYTVTAEVVQEGGGSVTGTGTYVHGSTCTLTAIPNEGYSVRGFFDVSTSFLTEENPYVFQVTQDHHCRVHFLLNSYSITVSASPNEGGTVSGGGSYNHGTTCLLTAMPNEGYVFVNWKENGTEVSTNPNYSFTVTGARDLVAVFAVASLPLPEENLVAYYPFDGDANDYSGNRHHGTIIGNLVPISDRYGHPNSAYLFPGEPFNYIAVPDAEGLHLNSFTLSAWVYTNADNYGGGYLVNKGRDIANGSYRLCVTGVGAQNYYSGSNGVGVDAIPVVNQWHMITGTVDGDQVRFYIDGELQAEGTLSNPFSCSNTEPLILGAHYYAGAPSNWTYTLLGAMDEVRIYSRAYTSQEVMHLYNTSNGCLSGSFSVADNRCVNFSQGNLQYQASTNKWRFATSQYDEVGTFNANVSSSYDGWVDLFGWGTSGHNHGAVCYQPYSTSTNFRDYYAYGIWNCNLYDQTGQADWGCNSIANGSSNLRSWRTLSVQEWSYVFNTRSTLSGIRFVKAIVNGVNGVILLPDDWETNYYSLNAVNEGGANYSSNVIGSTDWIAVFESYGAVFLPANGHRKENTIYDVGEFGGYWTSSACGGVEAYGLFFSNSGLAIGGMWDTSGRYRGHGVRLVADLVYYIQTVSNPEGGGTLSGGGTFNYGATCTLTATPNEGYVFVNWTENGTEVSTNPSYDFGVTGNRTLVANFDRIAQTQTDALPEGWSWWSLSVEARGEDALAQLEESLVESGVMIKSRQNGFVNNYDGLWLGSLTSIDNESSYLIQTTLPCELTVTGLSVDPSLHLISLEPGWNWIGYPCSSSKSVTEALSGLTPSENDMLKSRDNGFTVYFPGIGWMGSLNTILPGMGLMYQSQGEETLTLTYPGTGKSGNLKKNATTRNNHWIPTSQPYPDNLTMLAVVEVDGKELRSDRYELGVFAGNECRGSASLKYEAALDRYVAYLTVFGEEPTPLRFGLYDVEMGEERFDAETEFIYVSNESHGIPAAPYVVRFTGATALDDLGLRVNLFPNPIDRGRTLLVGMDATLRSPIRVEVVNEWGAVISCVSSNESPVRIKAPESAGVYLLRIVVEGKGSFMRKLVVK